MQAVIIVLAGVILSGCTTVVRGKFADRKVGVTKPPEFDTCAIVEAKAGDYFVDD